MNWPEVLAIIGANIAMISWLKSDIKSFEVRIETWKDQINAEIKDFHGKLCILEEKNKDK